MQFSLDLKFPLAKLAGIGSIYKTKLENLGLNTIFDLLYYFPFRYEDLSNQQTIINLSAGNAVTVKATVWQVTKLRTRNGRILIKASLQDLTGSLDAIWFNQEYLLTVLKPNTVFSFSGKVDFFGRKLTLINPKFEKNEQGRELIHTGRLIPIYSESGGLTTRWLRSKIHQLLTQSNLQVTEILPSEVLVAQTLINRETALKEIHFPTTLADLEKARERLAFEELFFLQLRNQTQERKKHQLHFKTWKIANNSKEIFERLLPFTLTASQKKALAEISIDLEKDKPMNRLLQGEVGSGKTVVCAFALAQTVENSYQGVLLAPTEVLAKQHFETLKKIFGTSFRIVLATASSKVVSTDFDIVVGTHAILNLKFTNLGLIVVDEQQKFGVKQRQALREKGRQTHFLSMSATPIPRTLALTIYGQLDISTLDQLPHGEKKIKTYLVPQPKKEAAYKFLERKIAEGGQLFVICPLINTSETIVSMKSARAEYERLRTKQFPKFQVGLLHGRMKAKEKDEVMARFSSGKIDVLVSTPVVEVGIDIPKANLIVIEAADRFGLASLHQLRGRIGRKGQESFCLLFTESISEKVTQRLKLLEKKSNGLDLAELDLKLRGPGDLFGTVQHGQIELKSADFVNLNLVERSHKVASEWAQRALDSTLKEALETYLPTTTIFSRD